MSGAAAPARVVLVLADLDTTTLPETSTLPALLRRRHDAIRATRRRRQWLLGRMLAWHAATVLRGRAFSLHDLRETPTGPVLDGDAGCRLCVSHSGNQVAAIASECASGVDLERLDAARDVVALAQHALPAVEAGWIASVPSLALDRFYRLWTLREAAYKAGLRDRVGDPRPWIANGEIGDPLPWWSEVRGDCRVTVVAAVPFELFAPLLP